MIVILNIPIECGENTCSNKNGFMCRYFYRGLHVQGETREYKSCCRMFNAILIEDGKLRSLRCKECKEAEK